MGRPTARLALVRTVHVRTDNANLSSPGKWVQKVRIEAGNDDKAITGQTEKISVSGVNRSLGETEPLLVSPTHHLSAT